MGRRVDMYSPEQQQPSEQQLMAPRMSFSCDFALEPPPQSSGPPRASTGDADFEFSVGGGPMIAADQLFSKGRMLPLREAVTTAGGRPVTLRDELQGHGANDRRRRADSRPSSGASRWKELLGLRKTRHSKGAAGEEAASADNYVDLGHHGETGV